MNTLTKMRKRVARLFTKKQKRKIGYVANNEAYITLLRMSKKDLIKKAGYKNIKDLMKDEISKKSASKKQIIRLLLSTNNY